ncbi:MAG: patatin-like phospholipase family protein [Massiliimalia sp.]|jgi:predicted patatin/cPLA2 family phospholipase
MAQIGLVLEGGGLRGTYTSGVLDAFMDEEIEFPYMIGVSAGVCNALSYISKQKGRSAQINIEHCNDKSYYSMENLLKTGNMFGEDMLFHRIPDELYPFDYQAYEENYRNTKLLAGTTDCKTGKAVFFEVNDPKNQYDIVKASCWLPFISKIVHYHGMELLDGGVADSIPVGKAFQDGCDKVVVVLTRPEGYRKQPSKANSLAHLRYRKYPNLIDAITHRYDVYNRTLEKLDELEKAGKILIIRPSEDLGISRLEKDREKLQHACEIGYKDGQAKAEQIKEWLK